MAKYGVSVHNMNTGTDYQFDSDLQKLFKVIMPKGCQYFGAQNQHQALQAARTIGFAVVGVQEETNPAILNEVEIDEDGTSWQKHHVHDAEEVLREEIK